MISMRDYCNTLLASMAAAQADPRGYRIQDGKIITSYVDPTLPAEKEQDPRVNEPDRDEEPDDEPDHR